MTLSRMLHFYRNRRSLHQTGRIRSRASENGAEHFVPRTLTQNFMNNEAGSGGYNSYSMLSNSVLRNQTINRRSGDYRQNFQRRNLIRNNNDDTHTIQENIENNLDLLSNN